MNEDTKKLYELPRNDIEGTKIYVEASDGSSFIRFHHTDGMYSYCTTEKGGIVHLGAATELVPHEDGWKFAPKI